MEARMNTLIRLTIATAAFSITPALADHTADHCGKSAQADGMRARVGTMNQQMDRIEFTADHGKRQELMDLHMKHMQEGMRELRRRDMPADCRIELMSSMMESMMRHQQLQQEPAK
jgi:hypothetical protein